MKLCMYGAGNTGRRFVENCVRKYVQDYTDIFFVDSNPELVGYDLNGYRVENMNSIDDNTEIIITSPCWIEIYHACCLNNFGIIGVYDINTNKVYIYKEMCRLKKCMFTNDAYIHHLEKKKEKIDIGINNFLQTGKLFENVNEVAIMLSNLCNYAEIHRKCPANCIKRKEILPSEIVFKIFNELEIINFDGTICFHIYNEPLIDPRLFWFIDYIKRRINLAKVEVYSNGYYLNDQMVKELNNIGVEILQVTGYGETEYNRLLDLKVDMAYCVLFGNLDERIDIYEDRINPISIHPCKTYFTQVSIYSNGDIGTCCLDYRHTYELANIYKATLKDSLNSERIVTIQKELLVGNRTLFPICKNCDWRR